MRHLLPALFLCALSAAATAESNHDDVPIYEGKWTVRVQDRRVATLVVEDWAGTWQERGAKNGAACGGRKLPITVHHSNPSELEFTAWGSALKPPCPDIAFTLKPEAAGTLTGTTGTGERVTMTRAPRSAAARQRGVQGNSRARD